MLDYAVGLSRLQSIVVNNISTRKFTTGQSRFFLAIVELRGLNLCCAVIYLFYGSLLTRSQKNKGKDISLLHLSSCFSNKATVL